MVNLSKLKLNDSNPRFIKDDKFEKLCKSIQETPNLLSKVKLKVDFSDGGKVLGGNMRLRALTHLKYKEIPESWVEDCSDLTEEEKRKLIIIDNASFGAWDFNVLANDWDVEELADWGIDIPNFEVEEIAPAEEDNFDTTLPEVPKTVLGDLYEIGVHRLLCGDSTDSDQVAKLMNGEKADMVFTDPPYDLEDLSFTDNIFLFSHGHQFICNSEQRNVDISSKHRDLMTRWYAIDFRQAHLIANNRPMNRVDFVVEFRNSEKTTFNNLHDGFTTLIECCKIHSNKGETIHTQEKKIELPSKFIEHFSNKNANILDCFLGSGSTMVASHKLKRKCYGMELSPQYCDVIVKRMITLDPSLTIKLNGVDVTNEWKQ